MIVAKIRTGDLVQFLAGKDRGKRGKVLKVLPEAGRVVVEGLNIRKKHVRPKRAGEKGQIVEFPGSVPAARVALVCPHCQKAIRVARRFSDAREKERWCRKCRLGITA